MSRLRQERERRGWTKTRLVLELEQRAATKGVALAARVSLMRMLARWENAGTSVDSPYRELFCETYSLVPEDFGWPERGQNSRVIDGEAYRPSLLTAVTELSNLAGHDVARNAGLLNAVYDPNALAVATLDWLVTRAHDDLMRTGTLMVTAADVAEIRQASQTFDQLDRQIGGEKSRDVAARFLRDRVVPRLNGMYSDVVGRDLFAATAVLCEIIGWMAYDAGRHAVGQRYFTQALRMAEAAGDHAFASYVVASMSDQALYLRQPEQALRLARAASNRAGSVATVHAEAVMLEARSHALLHDARASGEALRRAEVLMSASGAGERPEWSSPFDEVVFSSHAGTCWVDLGSAGHALGHFASVLDQLRGQPRRQLYGTIQLARIALLGKDAEQAAALGLKALGFGGPRQSMRSYRHMSDLAVSLKPHVRNSTAREFIERVRAVPRARG